VVKPAVEQALTELRDRFGADAVQHKVDGAGGAYVIVNDVDLGDVYTDETRRSWMGFHIGFQHPMADIYPHFVRPDLKRVDGRAFGSGISATQYGGYARSALQLSRRSNHRDPAMETALIKMLKVLDWIRSGP
jgi:hypothetical protein